MKNRTKVVNRFIIGVFVSLYLMVSIISTIHVVSFFELSNPKWLSIFLAAAFEVGAAASLASIVAMEKMNKSLVWALFFVLTAMQAMGNTYYAYVNLHDFQGWSELFGIIDEEIIYQKRILSLVSGAILPLVALGFIKSLVDYIKPESESKKELLHSIETEDLETELHDPFFGIAQVTPSKKSKKSETLEDISEPLRHGVDASEMLSDLPILDGSNSEDSPIPHMHTDGGDSKIPEVQPEEENITPTKNAEVPKRERPTQINMPSNPDMDPTKLP